MRARAHGLALAQDFKAHVNQQANGKDAQANIKQTVVEPPWRCSRSTFTARLERAIGRIDQNGCATFWTRTPVFIGFGSFSRHNRISHRHRWMASGSRACKTFAVGSRPRILPGQDQLTLGSHHPKNKPDNQGDDHTANNRYVEPPLGFLEEPI